MEVTSSATLWASTVSQVLYQILRVSPSISLNSNWVSDSYCVPDLVLVAGTQRVRCFAIPGDPAPVQGDWRTYR